jgi:polyhydroxyalkanoate synthesis regulator phasin
VIPTPEPEPSPSETLTSEPTPTPEPSIEPVEEVIDNASADGIITDEETQAIVDNLLSDGDLSTNELTDLVDGLQSDGQLSEEEKQLLSDVLVEAYEDTAIPSDVFEASGLDYEDLPPEQPITLDNGVVITAEIADAIEIFEDPAELLATVFTDPSKALKAISNVGADMTAATRKDAQEVTVAAVIVSQVIAGTSALTLARK